MDLYVACTAALASSVVLPAHAAPGDDVIAAIETDGVTRKQLAAPLGLSFGPNRFRRLTGKKPGNG
jgi:hypothetical protein